MNDQIKIIELKDKTIKGETIINIIGRTYIFRRKIKLFLRVMSPKAYIAYPS